MIISFFIFLQIFVLEFKEPAPMFIVLSFTMKFCTDMFRIK